MRVVSFHPATRFEQKAANKPMGVWVVAFILSLHAAFLTGCAFQDHRFTVSSLVKNGNYKQAITELDRARREGLYDDNNILLYDLDRGTLALIENDTDTAFDRFEDAETTIERNFTRSLSNDLASYLLNDQILPYSGEPYEDQYVNVFKLLIQLKRGRIVNGATVEARRLIDKVDLQYERYVTIKQKLLDDPDLQETMQQYSGAELVETEDEGRFLESTLGTYLSIITWTLADEPDFQHTAIQRLLSAIRMQKQFMPGVEAENFTSLTKRFGHQPLSLLVVAFTGHGPSKRAETLRLGLVGKYALKVEWPALVLHPSRVRSVRVRIDGNAPVTLPMVENMAGVAAETYRRELPLIRAKAIGRAVFKSIARYAVIESAEEYREHRREEGKKNAGDDLLLFTANVLGIFITETEQADLRHWASLPGQAYASVFTLEPGEHTVTTEFLDRQGRVMGRPKSRKVTISGGEMQVVDVYKLR